MVIDSRLGLSLLACSLLLAVAAAGCIEDDSGDTSDSGSATPDAEPTKTSAADAASGRTASRDDSAVNDGEDVSPATSGDSALNNSGQQGANDSGSPQIDSAVSARDAAGDEDGSAGSNDAISAQQEAAADAFDPGPAVPIVVNSGSTADYNLSDGEYKLFYFDAESGQTYTISPLSGIVRGYVSTSAEVSASNYQYATDEAVGTVSFVAPEAARYYIAVVVSGGGASGPFQVADGGQLVSLGATSVTLDAPNGEDTWFFHFPISAGTGYNIEVQGPASPAVIISAAPRPERSRENQLLHGAWGMSGNLPLNNDIEAISVSQSTSGFYYFSVKVFETMAVTITLSQQ
ncbi:MAG: hypothetical protein JXA30_15645 [Deltaproteobacteria bacterium]|nr:hypothetical protein [Deltaproteobacteria bacterium]